MLLGATIAAVGFGVWAIGGITRHDPGGSATSRQLLYAAAGGIILVAATLIDPALYRRFWRALYVGLCGVMGFVLVFGAATRGSKRWVDIGFFTFQPSEFGKVILALVLAAFLADNAKQVTRLSVPLKAIALAGLPVLLVFMQPDAGTALVYTAVLTAVLFVSGVRWLHLALIGAIGLCSVLAVLWWLPGRGCQRAQALPDRTVSPNTNSYNLRSRRSRSAPAASAAAVSPARPRLRSTICPPMRRTSRSRRSPSSAASSARPRSCCSTCSSSGAA